MRVFEPRAYQFRNCGKDGLKVFVVSFSGVLAEVVAVGLNDRRLQGATPLEVAGAPVLGNHCGHAANQKVLLYKIEKMCVDRLVKSGAGEVADRCPTPLLTHGIHEFAERERVHVYVLDSAHRDADILCPQSKLQERSRADHVEIGHLLVEVAQGKNGLGALLDLVQEQERLSGHDFPWSGDLAEKAASLTELFTRKLLPEVKRSLGYDGSARPGGGPCDESSFVKIVELAFYRLDAPVPRIEIPVEITTILCTDPPNVRTLPGTVYLTVSDQDMVESKVVAIFTSVTSMRRSAGRLSLKPPKDSWRAVGDVWYGLPGQVGIDHLARAIDPGAYITADPALHRHGLITQVPARTVCFTNRRYNLSRERTTPLGMLVFACVKPPVYDVPDTGDVGTCADAIQALFDFVHISRRDGVDPQSIATFRAVNSLDAAGIARRGENYPAAVRDQVGGILRQSRRSDAGSVTLR